MDSFFSILQPVLPSLPLIIFIGMLFEGNATLFAASFLASRGLVNPLLAFLAVFLGALIEEIGWYWFGQRINGSSHWLSRWARKLTEPFNDHLLQKPFRTLLISKFIYGLHRAVMTKAGILGLNTKTFLKDVSLMLLVWIGVVGGLGFLAGASVNLVSRYFRYAEIGLLVLVIT